MIFALAMGAIIASTPTLGMAAGTCRSPEPGPAILVEVPGLKDRKGRVRIELYPANDRDFLADDNVLISVGKAFARVEIVPPSDGPVMLCIRAPGPGRYALVLLHDRDRSERFDAVSDGIGFPGNPRLGWGKPHAAAVSVAVGTGLTRITIVPNYLHGLTMRPEHQP